MPELSIGVQVCHKLAAGETTKSQHQYILPDHLFEALFKLAEFNNVDIANVQEVSAQSQLAFQTEVADLLEMFIRFKLEPPQLRYRLRALTGQGQYPRTSQSEHIARAPQSRVAFERASQLALEVDAPFVQVRHLLAALLELKETAMHRILTERHLNSEILRQVALAQPEPSRPPLFDDFRLQNSFPAEEVVSPLALQETKRTELLVKMASLVMRKMPLSTLLELVLEELSKSFPGAERQTIALQEDQVLVPRAYLPLDQAHLSFTLAKQAMKYQQITCWVRQTSSIVKVSGLTDTSSALYAPLLCNGEELGVLHLDTIRPDFAFNEKDSQLLGVIASIVAQAIQVRRADSLPRLPVVFISYVREDREWVSTLADDLRRHRIKVWYDARLGGGENWSQKIRDALETADCFVLVMTELSVTSDYVLQELDLALSLNKLVIPLLCRPCQQPKAIYDIQRIKLSDEITYPLGLEELVKALNQIKLKLP